MAVGALLLVGIEYSVNVPEVVILATLLATFSTNHKLPSGPLVIPWGVLETVGTG
jgi:hypothetical protein